MNSIRQGIANDTAFYVRMDKYEAFSSHLHTTN